MINIIKQEILSLKSNPGVNQLILKKFLKRLKDNPNLVRDNNISDHFCTFFVPFDLTSKAIFLGNHLKAGGWIPPGGHIDLNELSLECVKREFFEELEYKLTDEKIKLFDLSIIHLNNPKHNCKVHYDFWYLVYVPKLNFNYDRKEFSEARWFSAEEAYKKVIYKEYKPALKKIFDFI